MTSLNRGGSRGCGIANIHNLALNPGCINRGIRRSADGHVTICAGHRAAGNGCASVRGLYSNITIHCGNSCVIHNVHNRAGNVDSCSCRDGLTSLNRGGSRGCGIANIHNLALNPGCINRGIRRSADGHVTICAGHRAIGDRGLFASNSNCRAFNLNTCQSSSSASGRKSYVLPGCYGTALHIQSRHVVIIRPGSRDGHTTVLGFNTRVSGNIDVLTLHFESRLGFQRGDVCIRIRHRPDACLGGITTNVDIFTRYSRIRKSSTITGNIFTGNRDITDRIASAHGTLGHRNSTTCDFYIRLFRRDAGIRDICQIAAGNFHRTIFSNELAVSYVCITLGASCGRDGYGLTGMNIHYPTKHYYSVLLAFYPHFSISIQITGNLISGSSILQTNVTPLTFSSPQNGTISNGSTTRILEEDISICRNVCLTSPRFRPTTFYGRLITLESNIFFGGNIHIT